MEKEREIENQKQWKIAEEFKLKEISLREQEKALRAQKRLLDKQIAENLIVENTTQRLARQSVDNINEQNAEQVMTPISGNAFS